MNDWRRGGILNTNQLKQTARGKGTNMQNLRMDGMDPLIIGKLMMTCSVVQYSLAFVSCITSPFIHLSLSQKWLGNS
jgi:hypothetical protein